MEQYLTIHVSCKATACADFLRNLANAIEANGEYENLHMENENGYADVIL